jgi:hypothetical protein
LFLFVYFLLLRKSYPRIPGSRKAFLTNWFISFIWQRFIDTRCWARYYLRCWRNNTDQTPYPWAAPLLATVFFLGTWLSPRPLWNFSLKSVKHLRSFQQRSWNSEQVLMENGRLPLHPFFRKPGVRGR